MRKNKPPITPITPQIRSYFPFFREDHVSTLYLHPVFCRWVVRFVSGTGTLHSTVLQLRHTQIRKHSNTSWTRLSFRTSKSPQNKSDHCRRRSSTRNHMDPSTRYCCRALSATTSAAPPRSFVTHGCSLLRRARVVQHLCCLLVWALHLATLPCVD